MIVKIQSERNVGGTIIKHWLPSQIKEVIIPIVSLSIQTQIEALITESFSLRKESNELLSLAKQAVEMAIEKDEERALKFIEEKINL